MVVSSPSAFARAVAEHPFPEFELGRESLAHARESLGASGLLVLGEAHGVLETPSVLYRLALALGTRAVAFEWSHEEMDEPLRRFRESGSFDFERMWSLPATSEFFCGDGRITAGHFALLERLQAEQRLDQVIVYDRLDPEPPESWEARDRDMAARLLAEWDRRAPLLVLTGAFHAQLRADDGEPVAAHLARELPGLEPAMLRYATGSCWSRGSAHDVSTPMPDAPIAFRLEAATPAVVPGPGPRSL